MRFCIVLIILALVTGCTKKEEKPKAVLDLIKKYQETQEEVNKYEAKMKDTANDQGLAMKLGYDKELAKSRLERLKEQLKKVSPESLEAPAPAEGGHGGGHH